MSILCRYFKRSTDFINSAVASGGLVVVNCYMGLSRSASCVLAYLMTKHDMSLSKVRKNPEMYRSAFLQNIFRLWIM